MKKITIAQLLEPLEAKQKKEFKRVYKYINAVDYVNWEEEIISEKRFNSLLRLVNKSLIGEDISLSIGFKYFRGNKLFVEKGVFIPQYDTEKIIDLLSPKGKGKTLLEIGTGTGAIAISARKEYGYDVTSIDINRHALKLAEKNASENEVEIKLEKQDIFKWEPTERFDVLISNPPYININDENVEKWVKENQPSKALYAELDGYAFYQRIILNYDLYIKPGGTLIFEIGYDQAKAVTLLAKQVNYKSIKVYKDLEGRLDRFVVIEFNE